MGGTIGVTIKAPDHTIYKMGRWTNTTPGFICNWKFITKDLAHLEEYLRIWQDMRRDWLQYGDTLQNPSPMSACYAQDDNMIAAPQGYGLVVIDYTTDMLLHCQGYTDYERLLVWTQDVGRANGRILVDTESETYHLRDLYFNGRAKRMFSFQQPSVPLMYPAFASEAELWSFVLDHCVNVVEVDLSPWHIVRFEETTEGYRQMYEQVKSLIALTPQDEQVWQEWLAERE